MHTAQTHEEASQTSKWSLLQKRLIIAKSSILGADYMAENFSLDWNFNSLSSD